MFGNGIGQYSSSISIIENTSFYNNLKGVQGTFTANPTYINYVRPQNLSWVSSSTSNLLFECNK